MSTQYSFTGEDGREWALNPDVSSRILSTDEATVVEIKIWNHTFVGSARTHPDDMPGDAHIGRSLAMARALKKARKHFRKQAYAELDTFMRKRKRAKKVQNMKPPQNLEEWENIRKKGFMGFGPTEQ